MGASERVRWNGLRPASRSSFLASRALLRRLLEQCTGVPADGWDISAEAGTAPLVHGPEHLRASLSHRLDWVAAAVSEGVVGIDLEQARPPRSDPAERAAMMLAPVELAAWTALPHAAREPALLTAWTAKEAWFKASPSQAAAWDFRQVVARACSPGQANVRAWAAPPLHVAVCCADPHALARVDCEGLDPSATSTFWHVARA
jgi:phosphopantetheinyl transferase